MSPVVRCLRTGVVRPKRRERGLRRYLPGGWDTDTLPVNVFLVEHREGLCLFDAGQTVRAAGPGYLPRWHPFLRLARFELGPRDEAALQLAMLGRDPAAVRWVVLSHLHTDHVGGLEPFRHAEVVVSGREWERFSGLAGRIRGYLPQHWPEGLRPRLVDLDGGATGPFSGSLDLTADGALVLVSLPGHTPGHMGLLVREGGRGGWLLAGDLARTAAELPGRAPDVAHYCERHGIVPLLSHDRSCGDVVA